MSQKGIKSVILAIGLALCSCNSADQKAVSSNDNKQVKPSTSVADNLVNGLSAVTAAPAALVDFDIFVYGYANDNQICLGQAVITINSDFTLKFPDSKLACASIVLDLSKLLSQVQLTGASGGMMSHMTDDGYALYSDSLMNATFQPARPLMIGPIITDRDKYKGYTKSVTTSVAANSLESGKTYQGQGTVELSTIDFNSYTNTIVGTTFDSIIHWHATTTGFDNIPKTLGLLFESMDWWFNTTPIMIPRIEIVASVSDFMEEQAGNQGISAMVGKVRIVLQVNNFKVQ